jgi:hypothetical protein
MLKSSRDFETSRGRDTLVHGNSKQPMFQPQEMPFILLSGPVAGLVNNSPAGVLA